MKKKKVVALIAHDKKKHEMVQWCLNHKDMLSEFTLVGTGHTAALVAEATGLAVKKYLPGPLGGDQQIGGKIAEKKIDIVIFFWDPLHTQPHDPDVKALLRIAAVYDIPIATNIKSADVMMTSPLIRE
ncbi:MAG: methylglyoxal synthase [Candidatus Enteromonas sp.]|nr:methylglyoxal synthase [Candidatus Enteromonas sp.]